VLDLSKLEAGKLTLQMGEVDAAALVNGAIAATSALWRAKGLSMVCDVPEGLPPIWGDDDRLSQVLVNLLSNAIKFTERGEVLLAVTADEERDAAGRVLVRVRVEDTGVGIPEDRMNRLFQSFSQIDTSTTRRFGGSGLGLAISQRLATKMGGMIQARSVYGKGSTFTFAVRLHPVAEVLDTGWPHSPGDSSAAVLGRERVAGRHALVVERHARGRGLLVALLRRWGMTVTARATLEDAAAVGDVDVAIINPTGSERDAVTALAERAPVILSCVFNQPPEAPLAEWPRVYRPIRPRVLLEALRQIFAGVPRAIDGGGQRGGAAAPLPSELRGLRVLLVEDSKVVQKVALGMLSRLGLRAELARDGREAVERCVLERPALVFMDIHMPELNGLDATKQIRERVPKHEQPWIIAMTASATREDRDRCLAAGMDDFIAKPFRVQTLVEVLERCQRRVAS
ncbi:MAG: response regulator, partial [Myxococcales bacterium]|nr:response regulator [Myxococcales bacterium]